MIFFAYVPRHLALAPRNTSVDLHKPKHRRVECTTVQTNYEGTNFAYWCTTHQDGADTPVICFSGDTGS